MITSSDLVASAQAACDEAKRLGGNRVVLAPVDRLAQKRLTQTDLSRSRVYTRPEVCRMLKMSRQTFQRHMASMPWAQEVLPRIGRRPKYLAAPMDRYCRGEWPLLHGPSVSQSPSRSPVQTIASRA